MSDSLACTNGLPGTQNDLTGQLADISSDVCYYGCFATLLYEAASQKYINTQSAINQTVANIVTIGNRMLQTPGEWGELETEFAENLLNSLQSIITTSGQQVSSATQGQSFNQILWGMLKGIVCRYSREMLLAASQGMVDDMEEALDERKTHLGILEQQIDVLKSALETLAQYDWWDDLVEAITKANQNLAVAEREVGRAYREAAYGQWDKEHVDMGYWRIAVAWQALSDEDKVAEFISEFGQTIKDKPFNPFDPAFFRGSADTLTSQLNAIGEALQSIEENHNCIVRLSTKLQMLRNLLILADTTLGFLNSNDYPGFALDVMLGDNTLRQLLDGVRRIRAQMKDVVENRRRTLAPVYVTSWRTELYADMLILKNFQNVPQPFGLPVEATDEQGSNELSYLVHPHVPNDNVLSLSEKDFGVGKVQTLLAKLIASAGNLGTLIANREQWENGLRDVQAEIMKLKSADARTMGLLETFTNYDSPKFGYVLDMLGQSGWQSAEKLLETGRVQDFLNLTLSGAVSVNTLSQCLGGILGMDLWPLGIKIEVDKIQDELEADAIAQIRSIVSLPSIQFRALTMLQAMMEDLQGQMQTLMDVSGVCG